MPSFIEKTWKCILIRWRTSKSQRESYTAILSRRHGITGGWLLTYSYKNESELEKSHELNYHKGYCEIESDKDLNWGKVSYFNNSGRKAFGVINLEKVNGWFKKGRNYLMCNEVTEGFLFISGDTVSLY